MNDIQLISKATMRREAEKEMKGKDLELVPFSNPVLSGKFNRMNQEQMFNAVAASDRVGTRGNLSHMTYTGKYGTGFDVPMKWSDGKEMSARERINSGAFMSGNTLPVDWDNLWDAVRIDATVRKAAMPTVRQLIYNITTNPNFTRTINPTEISPFGVVFEENNGHGQAIPQGETLGGGFESITILIYAAGFTWDLMATLFDRTITPERLMDAVMVGANAKQDDIAISPILDFTYSGVQQTPANTASGAGRQELLYLTLEDAIDDLGDREHPVTGRKLSTSDLLVLAAPYDAKHIARVARGLPSVNEKEYPGLTEIRQVVEYDGESVILRDRTITYDGVTKGTAYMLIPASALSANGYMEIAIKRGLTVEVDLNPDVKTLAQEERAYWFAEGVWYKGIQYFVQEITLPAW